MLLAVFGGSFGLHRFFLGQWWGLLYALFFWTLIPGLIGVIEGIVFLATDQGSWNARYNHGVSAGDEAGMGLIVLAAFMPYALMGSTGILAAIAVPAYQDYQARASVASAMAATEPVKAAVVRHYHAHGQWPGDASALPERVRQRGAGVGRITVNDGSIRVEPTLPDGVTGALVLTPKQRDGGIVWGCDRSTLDGHFLPPGCGVQTHSGR